MARGQEEAVSARHKVGPRPLPFSHSLPRQGQSNLGSTCNLRLPWIGELASGVGCLSSSGMFTQYHVQRFVTLIKKRAMTHTQFPHSRMVAKYTIFGYRPLGRQLKLPNCPIPRLDNATVHSSRLISIIALASGRASYILTVAR